MRNDPRISRIASSCFGSGVATFMLLRIFAPAMGLGWALLASFAGGGLIGYLGYNWRAVASACRKAATELPPAFVRGCQAVFSKPRPFFWSYVLLWIVGFSAPLALGWYDGEASLFARMLTAGVLATMGMGVLMIFHVYILLIALDYWASSSKKWGSRLGMGVPMFLSPSEFLSRSVSWRDAVEMHIEAGYNLVRGLLIAIGAVLLSPFLLAYVLLRYGPSFVAKVFRLIHSDERTICFVNGPLGAFATWFALGAIFGQAWMNHHVVLQIAYAALGGMVSIGLGLVAFIIGFSRHWLPEAMADAMNGINGD